MLDSSVMTFYMQVKGNLHDIYGVCSIPSIRRKKFKLIRENSEVFEFKPAQYLFNFTLDILGNIIPNAELSLGIQLTNQDFPAALRVYTRGGFSNPTLSRTLNIPTSVFPFPILKLSTNIQKINYNRLNHDEATKKAETIKELYDVKFRSKFITEIVIRKSLNDYIQTHLARSYENGMSFILTKDETQPEEKFFLTLVCPSIILGTERDTHMASTFISAHTHPILVARAHDSLRSWPSGQDQIIFLERTIHFTLLKVPILNIVPSEDGYYIWQPTNYLLNLIVRNFAINGNNKIYKTNDSLLFIFILHFTIYWNAASNYFRTREKINDAILQEYVLISNQFSIASMLKELLRFNTHVITLVESGSMTAANLLYLSGFLQIPTTNIIMSATQTVCPQETNIFSFITDIRANIQNPQFILDRFKTFVENFNKPGQLNRIIETECQAAGLNMNEPLTIQILNNDFVINPNLDSSSIFYFNCGDPSIIPHNIEFFTDLQKNLTLSETLDPPAFYDKIKTLMENGGVIEYTTTCEPVVNDNPFEPVVDDNPFRRVFAQTSFGRTFAKAPTKEIDFFGKAPPTIDLVA